MEVFDDVMGKISGTWLTPEEYVMVENSVGLIAEELQRNGFDEIKFWGKLIAESCDYIVLVARSRLDEGNDFPVVRFFFCTNKDFVVRPLESEWAKREDSVRSEMELTGDPSKELVPSVEGVPGDEESEGTLGLPAFTEKDLLLCIVYEVNEATAVVPKGAFIVDPYHCVVKNGNFSGLSVAEAGSELSYFHFREPLDPIRMRDEDGLIKKTGFLDPITNTHPKGAWSITSNPCMSIFTLRSLLYPGYVFYHKVGTSEFGGAYFGTGQKNEDIAFML